MKQEAQNWFDLAESDYDASLYLFDGARYPQAIYLLCQALEKLLKAAQVELANEAPAKTHNLRTIANRTGLQFSTEHVQMLRSLDRDYQRVRYRDMAQALYNTKVKTEPILEQGQQLYRWIQGQLQDQQPNFSKLSPDRFGWTN